MPGREERFGGRTKKPLDEMIEEALKNAPDIGKYLRILRRSLGMFRRGI